METTNLKTEALISNLSPLVEFVGSHAEKFGLDPARVSEIMLAVEEAAVNVFNYAYPYGTGEVGISCTGSGDTFIIEITDSGIPFDVLSLPDPDTTSSIEERNIGGLGVYFIRQLMDEVSYRREDGKNILHFVAKRRMPG